MMHVAWFNGNVLLLLLPDRSMVFNSADVIGQLEGKILKIQSDMRTQRVQMDKFNLDMHWRHVSNNNNSQIQRISTQLTVINSDWSHSQ